jgi:hypothetical protein
MAGIDKLSKQMRALGLNAKHVRTPELDLPFRFKGKELFSTATFWFMFFISLAGLLFLLFAIFGSKPYCSIRPSLCQGKPVGARNGDLNEGARQALQSPASKGSEGQDIGHQREYDREPFGSKIGELQGKADARDSVERYEISQGNRQTPPTVHQFAEEMNGDNTKQEGDIAGRKNNCCTANRLVSERRLHKMIGSPHGARDRHWCEPGRDRFRCRRWRHQDRHC